MARALRRNCTPSEALLWEQLRLRRLDGVRFRRQHPFAIGYVVDFFAPCHKLVVEQALELDEHERLEVVSEILASVDGPADEDWEQAWADELREREARVNRCPTGRLLALGSWPPFAARSEAAHRPCSRA